MLQRNEAKCFKGNISWKQEVVSKSYLFQKEKMVQDAAYEGFWTENHALWASLKKSLPLTKRIMG